jgi:drug/metabolite transporter (DMT)-like permease
MDTLALLLVLAAAAFHAGWNRLLHGEQDRVAAMAVAGYVDFLLLLPAMIASPPFHAGPLILLSALGEAGYVLCLAEAYRRGALSLAYPIGRGTAPLLVTLGGIAVLAQPARPITILAALSLGAGLVLAATAGDAPRRRSAVAFAVLTGCFIAAYSLVDARAVRLVSPPGYLGLVLGLTAVLLTIWLRLDWARLRRALRPGILIGVGSIVAYLLVLFAFQRAGAGRVATLREISVLIGLLIAADRPGPRAWLGGVLVVIGAILAAL